MNIEQRFQQISQSNYEALDGDSFLAKLHGERQKRHMKKMGFINGITAAVIVAVFGFVTLNQLTDDPAVYASNDLIPLEVMDEATEEYVYDLAGYLVDSSDDIWETLAFLDEIEFEPVATMNDGGIQ
ncbi:MAG: hypothetical protein ISR82_07300 [Candidatus Marinimicrobia bacterium]|nr:hypothetical protein [Candidatus Neomarinimicrobiota bacterium]MBL7011011.1 hypothetical protein [Candidatus Neomarinimicrobiota bacterium]